MFTLLSWLIYGLIVGCLAKFVVSFFFVESDVFGVLPTLLVGAVGSFVGGGISFLLNGGYGSPFETSGIVMGTVGAAVLLAGMHYFKDKMP